MQESIPIGKPCQPRLDPPSADPRRCHPPKPLGILAFGSLISEPGSEIEPQIRMRIRTTTPFPVEYARISATRGGAPTLVPHESGAPVSAQILVLDGGLSVEDAQDMLWRRETRNVGTGKKYPGGSGPNAVLVAKTKDPRVETVLCTDFNPEGKVKRPTAQELAKKAIESVGKAKAGMDGISYLIDAIAAGIETPLTTTYKAEILKQTGTVSLEGALRKAKSP